MRPAERLRRGLREACLAGCILLLGCGIDPVAPAGAGVGANLRVDGALGEAESLEIPDGRPYALAGAVTAPQQPVVFAIGPTLPGQRLLVRVESRTPGFDPAVAVFDQAGDWMDLNEDGGAGTMRLDAGINLVSRRTVSETFVVVSASPRSDSVGDFLLTLERGLAPALAAPADQAQRLYLNFHGAKAVRIGGRPPVDVAAFSGAMIDPAYSDSTALLRALVTARIRQDFAGLHLEVYASQDGPPPDDPYSVVHFGSYDPALLGVADSIDVGNRQLEQDAVIFVDTFAVFAPLFPSAAELGDALANVASHEIGHLLGLQHTDDPVEIMDTTAGLVELLLPQSFGRAPLHPATFPTGYQDAPEVLGENLGGHLATYPSRTASAPLRRTAAQRARGGIRTAVHFGTACR